MWLIVHRAPPVGNASTNRILVPMCTSVSERRLDGASGPGGLPRRRPARPPDDRRLRVRVDAPWPGPSHLRRGRPAAGTGTPAARATRRAPRLGVGPALNQPARAMSISNLAAGGADSRW